MSFFESDYTPTDADLQDWIHVLKLRWLLFYGMNEAEETNCDHEDGLPYESWRFDDTPPSIGPVLDPWGDPIPPDPDPCEDGEPDDSMGGDATSALESVYGSNDSYPEYDYDDGWCDFEDNGEGFAC